VSVYIGDRVFIVGREHPWHGSVGTVKRPWVLPGNGWEIELDNPPGHECAAHEDEVRLLARAEEPR
jgi:hypothetical protein